MPEDLEDYLMYSEDVIGFVDAVNIDIDDEDEFADLRYFDFAKRYIKYSTEGKDIRATYDQNLNKPLGNGVFNFGQAILDLKFSKDGSYICVDGYMKVFYNASGKLWVSRESIEPIVLYEKVINTKFRCSSPFDTIYQQLSKGKVTELQKRVEKLRDEKNTCLSKQKEIERRLKTIDKEILAAEREYESYKILYDETSEEKDEARKLKLGRNRKQA